MTSQLTLFYIIFRSKDRGTTWSQIWQWESYPTRDLYYHVDASKAPWVFDQTSSSLNNVGWMMESIAIDPFDSNHWMYGTGM
jgi:xyloglucan-specific exo-beta-1,4-glucanase